MTTGEGGGESFDGEGKIRIGREDVPFLWKLDEKLI